MVVTGFEVGYSRAEIYLYHANIIYAIIFLCLETRWVFGEETHCLEQCRCDEMEGTVTCEGITVTELPQSIPSGFDVLRIKNASISQLTRETFRKMDRLREIHIENCDQLETIEKLSFKGMRRELTIRNCPHFTELLKGVFSGIGNDAGLKIRVETPIKIVHPGILRHAQNIRELVITGQHMILEKHAFSCITQIDFLTLTGVAKMEPHLFTNSTRFYMVSIRDSAFSIPKSAFDDLAHVHQVLIQKSKLKLIGTDSFAGLSTVESIDFFDNTIGMIEAHAFSAITNLGRLRLARNTIRQMDSPEAVLVTAHQIRFEENIVTCSCALKWISAHPDRRLGDSNYCGAIGVHRTIRNYLRLTCDAQPEMTTKKYAQNYKVTATVSPANPCCPTNSIVILVAVLLKGFNVPANNTLPLQECGGVQYLTCLKTMDYVSGLATKQCSTNNCTQNSQPNMPANCQNLSNSIEQNQMQCCCYGDGCNSTPPPQYIALAVAVLTFFFPTIPKITRTVNEFHEAIEINDWEWAADAKSDGNDQFRFELTDYKTGDALYVDILSTPKNIEAKLLLWINGEKFESDRLVAMQTGDKRQIQCGPLKIEIREPFRRCRIFYRGEVKNQNQESLFLTIGGWFKPTSDARYFYSNLRLENSISKSPWKISKNLCRYQSQRSQQDFVQWGEACLEIGLGGETMQKRFRGLKETRRLPQKLTREDQISVYFQDGHRFLWRLSDFEDSANNVEHGVYTHVDSNVRGIALKSTASVSWPDEEHIVRFGYGKSKEAVFAKLKVLDVVEFSKAASTVSRVYRIDCDHEGSRGIAFITIENADLFGEKEKPLLLANAPSYTGTTEELGLHVVPISTRMCQDPELTGGKGSNLAKLTALKKEFQVPSGFVVTTAAYRAHLKKNQGLYNLIKRLEKGDEEELGFLLEQIEAAFFGSEVSKELLASLDYHCKSECGDARLAVRSSALGEDGADLSSAGQLESVLNVEKSSIEDALKKCWASNFRREVYSYRRSHGQPLAPEMGVVVQEMVADAVAGVMFTCDPVRRDPTHILINAIRGAGDDIVSGAVTPDTVLLDKAGNVQQKPENCCLTDTDIATLSSIGIYLETSFGRPQDVEFVIKNSIVYLVQSRDVTGLDRESEFELATEFNSGTLTDEEIYSTANVGEVLAKPLTPLGVSVSYPAYEKALCKMFQSFQTGRVPLHHDMGFHMSRNKVFMNIGELYLRQWEVLEKDPLSEYTLAGEKMLTPEMYAIGRKRHTPRHKLFPLWRLGYMLHATLWGGKNTLGSVENGAKTLESLISTSGTPEEMMRQILRQKELFSQLIYDHAYISSCSSFTYIIVAMIIRGGPEGDLTSEMLSDIATLFGNNDLSKIAKSVKRSPIRAEFENAEGDFALKILKSDPEIAQQIDDIYAEEWRETPDLLVETIKAMLNDPKLEEDKVLLESGEIMEKLKNKPKGLAKKFLKFMVKQTYSGVANREFAKNLLVKGNVAIRANIRKLGQTLADQGLLPDKDLVFYMTLHEIQELMQTRSPRLISRAMRRRTHFPKQSDHRYHHVMWGCVEPIETEPVEKLRALLELQGTPVCEGKVVGKARVAKTLEEARGTQPGEILITRFTDICWSPFFPLIRGIVTEIGGLLSHGAVVAREYGLPSLIAVRDATDVFQTGDLVSLDSFKGTITKMEA
ncbi:unnamed protein product, partial [Mesorhabditis spiculigera]